MARLPWKRGTVTGNGNGRQPIALLEAPGANDGWRTEYEARPVQSGVWVVFALPSHVEQGKWRQNGYTKTAAVEKMLVVEADSGVEAMHKLYDDLYDADDPKAADGRYVALDFYGGERVEALVTGEWRVDLLLAPPTLGRPEDS